MKKILITGGAGFVGSNFVHALTKSGDEVNLIVRPESDLWRIESVKSKLQLHTLDLTKAEEIKAFVGNLKPEIILHFAAYGAYPGRPADPQTMILTNILGTANLLEACAETGFKCFINTGSSSEYGEKDHPISEKDLLEPNNLYGVSKAAGTLFCQLIARKTGLPIITARLFSPYGYFEEGGRLMPNLAQAALGDKEFNALSPAAVRDFVFIEDVIDAYMKMINSPDRIKGQIFNIASGKQYSIAEVVAAVEKILNKKIQVTYGKVEAKQREPKMWVADISKAREVLGWSPAHSLEDGLRKYITWAVETNS